MVPYNVCWNTSHTLAKLFNSTSMISEKQTAFRQEYRARIAGWYNGFVHVAVIYIIGLTAMWIYIQHLENVAACADHRDCQPLPPLDIL